MMLRAITLLFGYVGSAGRHGIPGFYWLIFATVKQCCKLLLPAVNNSCFNYRQILHSVQRGSFSSYL